MKIITARMPDGTRYEHYNQSFSEVYEEYRDNDVELWLENWNGVFYGEAYIGNCLNLLHRHDYYDAYDKLF